MNTSTFWQGFRAGAPFVVVIVPFGMVFGVVGTEAGLSLAQVMGFTFMVIAGAAQFTAVQLMTEEAPTFIVLLTSLAVNLRMAMYSASLAPYLGRAPFWKRAAMSYAMVDQSYAVSVMKYETTPAMTTAQRSAYFFGTAAPLVVPWYLATWAGAALGTAIPPGIPIDFAVPITFLALITPMLRTRAHWAAAAVSVVLALLLRGLPYNLGLLVAALCAMATGAALEKRATDRATTRGQS